MPLEPFGMPQLADFAGIKVMPPVDDRLMERQEPKRKHKKRRNQSAAYHRRVQKKWTKRWGTKTVRIMYLLSPRVLGLGRDEMVLAAGRREFMAMKMGGL